MSYKYGKKARFIRTVDAGCSPDEKYTVYVANESVSDINQYKMFDDKDKEVDIEIGYEDDSEAGYNSLIDVLYCLKHCSSGKHYIDKYNYVEVEELSWDEIQEKFRIK